MKVLVGCEFSGVVRDAFIHLGHDAVSCDFLPSLSSLGPHYEGDVRDIIKAEKWDLFICHPPCTYLSVVGNKYFKNNPERCKKRIDAFNFALSLFNVDIPKVCMENPAGYLSTHFRKPDQIINPYLFGDNELKRTCLWLRGLPELYYTVQFPKKPKPKYIRSNGKRVYFTESLGSQPKKRSKTFLGIAAAMASQWGGYAGEDYFFNKY